MKLSNYILLLVAALQLSFAASAQNTPNAASTAVSGGITTAINPPLGNLSLSTAGPFNYERTFVPLVPMVNTNDVSENTSPSLLKVATVYSDGLNRPMESVQRNFIEVNGVMKHLITPAVTDFSTQQINLLPYTSENANMISNPVLDQKSYYNSMFPDEMTRSFSATIYQSDANTRQTVSYAPGLSQVGQGRGATTKQTTNAANTIWYWVLDASGNPVSNSYYNAGELFGEYTTNVQGAETTIYKNKDGRVVCQIQLQKTTISGQNAFNTYGTTYYVYDVLGRLRYMLPPKATDLFTGGTLNTTVLNNLCFQYKFENGLQVSDRKPGESSITEYVFDRKKRLVMRRTPNELDANTWEVTYYDISNRIIATSLYQNTESRTVWQNRLNGATTPTINTVEWYLMTAAGEGQYPADNAANKIMSYTYYDNYTLADPGSNYLGLYGNYKFMSTELSGSMGAEMPTIGSRTTQGMPTGGWVRILPSPGALNTKTANWRKSAIYYDDKGRPVYTVSMDYVTNNVNPIHAVFSYSQYDFSNKLLMNKQVMQNTNSTDGVGNDIHTELTYNEYDASTGRLVTVKHKMDAGAWQILGKYSYDGMGRVRQNILGNYGEVQDLSYNIRGQLDGINSYYAETGNKQSQSRSFGESLKYDYGFSNLRYDGKIAGMIWRGSNTGKNFAYGYNYDKGGRLTQADFRQKITGQSWSNQALDYTVSNLQYDLNGNIQFMNQMGVNFNTAAPVEIDRLVYGYQTQSNRLQSVSDVSANYGNGDFVENNSGSDYDYDKNGNLTMDLNKGISSITYTHFNKPSVITFSNHNKIEYSYDAAGSKVQELQYANNVLVKTTDYIANYVYENDKVQFAGTGNGRTTFKAVTLEPKEEFFVKDHLGNVRSLVDVYTYPILEYLTSYELASANIDNLYFENVDGVRAPKPGSTFNQDVMSARLNGAEPDRRIGTSILLHVMAGDKVEMNVNNFYENYDSNNDNPVPAEEMLSGILSTLNGGMGSFQGSESHDVSMVDKLFTPGNYEMLQNIIQNEVIDPARPKAYLNYVLFDENMRAVREMTGAYQANGDGAWTAIGTTTPLDVPTNGYLGVYLSNSTVDATGCLNCGDVFFDQLVIRMTRGKLKEESHYYPFGLPMAGMGSADPNTKVNRRKYQGNEYNTELGLTWMNFNARQYDPQIGRFLGVDPLADAYGQQVYSPYAAMGNMPESAIDPNGASSQNFEGGDAQIAFRELQSIFGNSTFDKGEFLKGGSGENWNTFLSNLMSSPGSYSIESLFANNSYAFMNYFMGNMKAAIRLPNLSVTAFAIRNNRSVEKNSGWAIATLGFISADIAIPEPTDGAWPKWVGYAAAGTTAYLYLHGSDLTDKMSREIDRILRKAKGPNGYVYELRVNLPGEYIDVRGNCIFLNAGDIWKFGQSTLDVRYSRDKLDLMVPGGVNMTQIYFGNSVEIKVFEKYAIYGYYFNNGSLPPGNSIFR